MAVFNYYLAAVAIIVLALLLMFVRFEGRRPKARELAVIAVLTALAVVGRAIFFMLPQFKPVAAIAIIAGVALGAESGFMVGALSAFLGNFIFGHGPWTPFQMLAFGSVGYFAGLLFHGVAWQGEGGHDCAVKDKDKKILEHVDGAKMSKCDEKRCCEDKKILEFIQAPTSDTRRIVAQATEALSHNRRISSLRLTLLCLYGGLSVVVLYGLIVDILYLLFFTESVSVQSLLAVLATGLPFNVLQGVVTIFFLAVLARPMLEKLERAKQKFGLMQKVEH
ncbi:MAG: ECF transporter S component [Coriobacteriales bacterium]|nr:ECF transporter S component [Coriobacteriales bacterium]